MSNWFISSLGNDNNNGTITSPFLTISKGMANAKSGDTIFIRKGIYREEIVAFSTPNNITLQAYQSEDVTISAFEVIKDFILVSDNIWKKTLTTILPFGKILCLVNGQFLKQAQWPSNNSFPNFPAYAIASTASTNASTASYTCSNLPASIPIGTKINFCAGGQWGWQTGTIISRSANTINFSFNPASQYGNACLPAAGDRFFLWGNPNISDIMEPGTYCVDSANDIFIRLSDNSNPHHSVVEIKTRTSLFNFWDSLLNKWGKQGYKFKNLKFLGAPLILGNESSECVFDNCHFSMIGYAWNIQTHSSPEKYYEDAFIIHGLNHKITNCYFFNFGSGVILSGENIDFTNNLVEYMNICGFNRSAVGIGSSSLISKNIKIKNNIIRYTGRSGTGYYNTQHFAFLNNQIYDFNILTRDNGGLYAVGDDNTPISYNSYGGEIAGNLIFNEHSSEYPAALYFDFACGSHVNPIFVHHNICIVNKPHGAAIRLHTPASGFHIFNNTFVTSSDGIGLSMWGNFGGFHNIIVTNNIFTAPLKAWLPEGFTNIDLKNHSGNGLTISHNIYHDVNPLFSNPSSLDFSLLSSSPAINSGKIIPPFTDGFSGSSPDCGAIQFNDYLIVSLVPI